MIGRKSEKWGGDKSPAFNTKYPKYGNFVGE